MRVFTPDTTKLASFLTPPLVFLLAACGFVIAAMGWHVGAILTSLLITLVVMTPFLLFILPTFLLEKIIIEDFTSRVFLVLFFFRIKRVLQIAEIERIEERHRNSKTRGPRELIITARNTSVLLSQSKYKREDILEMVKLYKQKNPKIRVSLLD